MPEAHAVKVERILIDLQSMLLDYDSEEEDWAGWVEEAMNHAWDRLVKLGGPDA